MWKELRTAFVMLVVLTLLTGIAYPLLVTGTARIFFPERADGSLLVEGGKLRGSEWIGQSFDDAGYFWGRPSATAPLPYSAAASSGSNLGPTNPALIAAVRSRIEALRREPGGEAAIPVDLVTASGSGLDPHVSPAAARFQVPRVAEARGVDASRVASLVETHIEDRTFGFLGEPRVDILELNLALDRLR